MNRSISIPALCGFFMMLMLQSAPVSAAPATLTLSYEPGWLSLHAPYIPGAQIRIHYLETYCRAGSTDADWVKHTMLAHTTEMLSLSADKKTLRLRDTLADGVIVEHEITAREDEVEFHLTAQNPTGKRSEAHWAQPCVRLAAFT